MAAPQTSQSRASIKALSLFGVLVLAKTCMVIGREFPFDLPTVLTLFWDDALLAAAFGLVEWLARKRPQISTFLYIAIVIYAAINVPVARLTSSPLTLPMMRATGSALSDSIAHHLTITSIGFMAMIVVAAIAFPQATRRISRQVLAMVALAPLGTLLVGAFLLGKSLYGFERNAFTVLVRSVMPQVQARTMEADWRAPIVPHTSNDPTLEFLRGAARGRNVLVVVLESTGAQYLKSYGAERDPTPNLTALARHAVLFENAYAVYPESIKGLFSTLCSRYPAFDTASDDYARVRTPALGEVLREAGYRTALFHSGRFMYLGMRSIIENRGFETLEDAGHIGGNHNSSFGVDEPSAVRRILQWIDGLKPEERFFLMYLPIAGHHPYEVPGDGPFAGHDERTRYLNSLHYGDAALGELLRGLEGQGRDTNTLLVVFGDHGEAFGQHNGNFGHTFFVYEENVHVPLLITAPGLIEKPLRIRNIASLIDVAPTIIDLAGLQAPPDWQGTSLLDDRARAALFFTDYSLPLAGMRDGPQKVICELGTQRARMFDLSTSPCETRDTAAHHPLLAGKYRQRLESWSAAQKALLRP